MHDTKHVRIEYDAYRPAHTQNRQPLTEREKHAFLGPTKAEHLVALFFLLQRVRLNLEKDGDEETSIHINSLGELGMAISCALLHSFDVLSTDQPEEEIKNENTSS